MNDPWFFDDQIRHNRRQTTWLFVIVFTILALLILAIGIVLGYPPIFTFPIAVIIGLIYLATTSSFSVDAILAAARAKPADPKIRDQKLLMYKVEELALAAGMVVPKVYVTPSKDINAFATGKSKAKGVIAVTQGAMDWLNAEELEGVLAHEMSHIANEDIRIQTYSIALIGLIAMLAEIMLRSLFWGGGRRGGRDGGSAMLIVLAVALVFMIVAPILSKMAHMAISRNREYLADATGAKMTRNPEGLASALAKIGAAEPKEAHRGEKTVAGLYLANPFKRVRKASMWATHPPIDERVARLRRM
jgi:heat shock protein HtpX